MSGGTCGNGIVRPTGAAHPESSAIHSVFLASIKTDTQNNDMIGACGPPCVARVFAVDPKGAKCSNSFMFAQDRRRRLLDLLARR